MATIAKLIEALQMLPQNAVVHVLAEDVSKSPNGETMYELDWGIVEDIGVSNGLEGPTRIYLYGKLYPAADAVISAASLASRIPNINHFSENLE